MSVHIWIFFFDFDVVFLDRVFLRPEGMNIIRSDIHTKNYVLMHVEPGKREYYKSVLKDAPDFFVFSNRMEKKEVAK